MFIYLSKKIAIPNNITICSLAWNKEHGYIACGGEGGLLKVLKLDMGKEGMVRGVAAPSNLSMNQTLEGHTGQVEVVTWNESFLKLTSSDQNGLIIVWMLYKGTWFEEMINNRNKSVVKGMAWNSDGQKICIVYEDGAVIVGSVDGNRIWGKELKGMHLTHVEWSPDGKMILFGMGNGEVQIYEQSGIYMSKVAIQCLPNASSSPLIGIDWFNGMQDADAYSLVIGYAAGRLQMMKTENDDSPLVVDTGLDATWLQWNHDGTLLAVTGRGELLTGSPEASSNDKKNMVKFYNPRGQHLHTLLIPGRNIACCSWEGGGLRIALAVDSFIFFANIRPDYKWCYFSNTVVYCTHKADKVESTIIFWNVATNERHMKYVKHLLGLTAAGDFCVLFTKTEDGSGQYAVILCNSIGTPVDSHYTDIEPLYVAMSSTQVFAASKEYIYMWHFQTPRGKTLLEISGFKAKSMAGQEKLCHVDDTPSGILEHSNGYELRKRKSLVTTNPICCITASEKMLIVGRESGTFQRYALPHLALTHRHTIECRPQMIRLNANDTRMSIIDISGVLFLYDFTAKSSPKDSTGELLKFERKDVWDIKWASDNNEMFAAMEKTRMYIYRDLDPEEPVMCSGYLCSFDNLVVRAVLLDDLILDPENPVSTEYIIQYEVKSLRDTRDLIEKVGISEASKFIEENSHPKLWTLLAEAALQKLDFVTAENAFVRSKDYCAIQFVKKAAALQNNSLKKAEVAIFFKDFEEAEKLYMELDRRDLAIAMRKLLGDWFRVVQLLKGGSINGKQLEEAWKAIGDFYSDRQKWESALTYYEQAHCQDRLASCYYMLEDYSNLTKLAKMLPENHPLLKELGTMFESVGMCDQAVEAYLKVNEPVRAMECCIQLNQWSTALRLAQKGGPLASGTHDISGLLGQYAQHLLAEGRKLRAVELYRKAGRHLDAANLMYQVIEEAHQREELSLPQLKKLHVLAAMLVEEHFRSLKEKDSHNVVAAINALLKDDATSSPNRLLDQPWRGAEAYHFLILTLSQLYDGYVDAAMKTALHLREYEDILNVETIYAILALSSCANRAFGTCSKAFIKLESLSGLSESQLQAYEELAVEIFLKHPPKDSRSTKSECAICETMIPDWCPICPSCNTRFPICVATGRPLMSPPGQHWTCRLCQHCAGPGDMVGRRYCPLCHTHV